MALEIKADVTETSTVERELSISISGDAVAKELDRAYRQLSQKVKLKGFRQGKVPRYVLEQYYKEDTESQVLERLVGQSYQQAITDNKLMPVSDPKIQASPELIPGMDYRFQATVEVKPVIDLKKWQELELTKTIYPVGDKQVDEQLEALRERHVQVQPVEGRDVVQQGDLVECNFSGKLDGEAVRGLGGVSYVVEVGAGRFYKEAEQALVGKKIDEQFDVDAAIPEDHRVKAAAGKTVTFSIKPLELKQKVMPDLDDDFVQDVSDVHKTVDEMRAGLLEEMKQSVEQRTRMELRDAAIDALIDENPFEIPGSLVDRQAHQMAMQALQGIPQAQAEQIWESQHQRLVEEAKPRAVRAVRGGLLLEKLVDDEKIEISDEDVDAKMAEIAIAAKQSVKQIKKLYKGADRLDDLRHQLSTERALDRVVDAATVSEKAEEDKTPASASAEDDG